MKRWRIDLLVNTAQAQSAASAATSSMGNVEKAAERAAKAAEAAAERQAKALDRAADRATRAADRAADAAVKAAERASARQQAETERQAKALDAAADRATRAADRKADAEVKAAERGTKTAEAAAERQAKLEDAKADRATRAADRAADKAVKAAERASARQQAETDRQAKSLDAAADRATRAADRRADAEAKATERGAAARQRAQDRINGANVRAWTDEEIQGKVSAQRIRNANEERIKGAMAAAEVEYRGNKNGWEGANMLAVGVAKVVTAYATMSTAAMIINGITEATKRAADIQEKLTLNFIRYRDTLREVESMRPGGKGATTAAALKAAEFQKATGMTESESTAFQTAFMGSGAQYAGKTMSQDDLDRFMLQAAKLTAAKGIEPGAMGEFAGTLAGTRDFKGDKSGAARGALGDFNQAISILQRGRGSNAALTKNASMLSAFALNPDTALGTFTNVKDMASAISVAAEVNPEEAEVFTRATISAIRDFEGKGAPLLKKAGIDKKTPFFESIRKIAPIVMKEARDSGGNVDDVLKKYGYDIRERKGLGAFINKGIEGKAIEDRARFGESVAGPAPAEAEIERFRADTEGAGPHRLAEAGVRAAEAERGAKDAKYETLRLQAIESMTRKGTLDSTTASVGDYLKNATTGWMSAGPWSREQRIQSEMGVIAMKRATEGGLALPGYKKLLGADRPVETTKGFFREAFTSMEAAGVNPLADRPGAYDAAGGKLDYQAIDTLIKQQNTLNAQQMELMRSVGPPGALPQGPNPPGHGWRNN